ncbi:MAG: molecular chaperone [Bacteroidales bacterium]|nr:molecular chaperone [Bacteroidales bacterium]
MFVVFSLSFLPLTSSLAQGNLLITPRRVVFEGSKRSFDLNLVNTGKDTATFAISLIQIKMKDDGSFETITEPEPDQRFADRNIRYFPRTVTLGPDEAQVVKIQLTRIGELTDGEYRSHFYFRALPNYAPLGEEGQSRDTTSISVMLRPVFGITIPVIIRKGESTARVTLSDLQISDDNGPEPVLSFQFIRTGNMSVFGDITVEHISPQGKIVQIGTANGVAVYTPNPKRILSLKLTNTEFIDLKSGKLRVTYSAPSDIKPQKYAENELILQ